MKASSQANIVLINDHCLGSVRQGYQSSKGQGHIERTQQSLATSAQRYQHRRRKPPDRLYAQMALANAFHRYEQVAAGCA
ncbi:hypothetical protein AAGS40_29880 (plasmid) [Paraburkholderia sp. PREW-6R]|uniref:hypothetical protein n=1 Tax=Paraburkholderia sp. PREW-6R TaxID=3141544 RepID=UPI0031F50DD5